MDDFVLGINLVVIVASSTGLDNATVYFWVSIELNGHIVSTCQQKQQKQQQRVNEAILALAIPGRRPREECESLKSQKGKRKMEEQKATSQKARSRKWPSPSLPSYRLEKWMRSVISFERGFPVSHCFGILRLMVRLNMEIGQCTTHHDLVWFGGEHG